MRFGNYSVRIPQGVEKGESGYTAVAHGQQYTVELGNHSYGRVVAALRIDGKLIGEFVLNGNQVATIERSPDDRGRFTFYADGTAEAIKVGLETIAVPDRGLIQVDFKPEKVVPRPTRTYEPGVLRSTSVGGPRGQSQGSPYPKSFSPNMAEVYGTRSVDVSEKTAGGITGLSGYSSQEFRTVHIEVDESLKTTLSLRLVALEDGPRPLLPKATGNPVPPPV